MDIKNKGMIKNMCCSCCNCCKKQEMISGVITKSIPLRLAYSMPKVNLNDIGSGIDSYGSGYSDLYSNSVYNSGIDNFSGVDSLSEISTKRSGCCCN